MSEFAYKINILIYLYVCNYKFKVDTHCIMRFNYMVTIKFYECDYL